MPAIHPSVDRSTGTKRPRKTAFGTVLIEELLRALDALVRDALEPRPAGQQLASPAAADDVADERSEHGRGDRDRDDRDDVPVALRRERAGGDQRRLAGDEREPRHLEEDDAEHDPEPVVLNEVRQAAEYHGRDWPDAGIGLAP